MLQSTRVGFAADQPGQDHPLVEIVHRNVASLCCVPTARQFISIYFFYRYFAPTAHFAG